MKTKIITAAALIILVAIAIVLMQSEENENEIKTLARTWSFGEKAFYCT